MTNERPPAFDPDANDQSSDPLAILIRAAGKRPIPEREDFERVLAASRAALQRKIRARWRRRWLYALAASIAAAAIVLLGIESRLPPPAVALASLQGGVELSTKSGVWEPLLALGREVPPGARLRTAAGGRAALALGNAASLRLDHATEIVVGSAIELTLDTGTVYIDSSGGTMIEVVTAFGTVRDVGTQFEIRSTADGLRVRVREGLVALRESAAESDLAGGPGEQLSIGRDGSVRRQTIAPDDPEWDWVMAVTGAPTMDGRTVFELLRWVARESGKELRFTDAATELAARRAVVSGNGAGLTPLDVLEVVVGTVEGLTYELSPGVILIRRR